MLARALVTALLSLFAMTAHAWTTCHGTTIDDPSVQLMPCGNTPNCVSTEHANPERRIDAPRDITLAAMRVAIGGEARSEIMAEGSGWLIAHFKSRIFGFVDEMHLIARPDGTLSIRSGACSGYWDMGVNGRRIQRLIERAREVPVS